MFKGKRAILITFLALFFSFFLVNAIDVVDDYNLNDVTGVVIEIPEEGINYSLVPTVNSSDFWDNLDTPADINLDDLGDVTITGPVEWSFLTYVSGLWIDSGASINDTIDSRTASIIYQPDNVNEYEGTLDSGNYTDVWAVDDYTVNVSESSGASSTFTVYNYSGVDDINSIDFRLNYEGGVGGHSIQICLYDYVSGDYECEYGSFSDTDGWFTDSVTVFDADDHISGGVVSLAFDHQDNGIASHDIFYDYVVLVEGFSVVSPTEVDPFAFHKSGDTSMEGNANWSGYNISEVDYGSFNYIDVDDNITAFSLILGDTTTGEDIYIYFNDDALQDEWIKWVDSNDRFRFSDTIYTADKVEASGGLISGHNIYTTGANDDLWLGTSLQANANTQINESGSIFVSENVTSSNLYVGLSEGDSCIYFYEDGSPTGESICWDNALDRFEYSDLVYSNSGITADGNLVIGGLIQTASDIYTTGTGDDLWLGTTQQASADVQINESGDIYILNDIYVGNQGTFGALTVDNISINNNLITSETGTIDFSDDNLDIGGQADIDVTGSTLRNGFGTDIDYTGSATGPPVTLTNLFEMEMSGGVDGFGTAGVINGFEGSARYSGTITNSGAVTLYGNRFSATFAGTNTLAQEISAYGIDATASGNMGTTGTTKHVGIQISALGTADNNYGLYITSATGATNNYAIYDASGSDWILDGDDQEIWFGESQDMSLGFDGTNGNLTLVDGADFYFNNESGGLVSIHAASFLTSTPVTLSYNADYLDTLETPLNLLGGDGKLSRDNLLDGEAVITSVKDPDNCWKTIDRYCYIRVINETTGKSITECYEEEVDGRDYDYTTERTECGTKPSNATSVDYISHNNRLMIAELKAENDLMKASLCKLGESEWC